MRCIIAIFVFSVIINGCLADSVLTVPCNATDPTVGYFYPGECAPALLDVGWQYIQCDAEQFTMYSCRDPFCSQCKILQQVPFNSACDPTGGTLLCIKGQIDYSKYFGADYVLTGVFGVRKMFQQQNATCEDDLSWVRIYKPNQCTPQVSPSGFSGSQITTCDQGVVSSRTYSTPDCSGTPVVNSNVEQDTCSMTSEGYIEMSTCSSN